MKRQAISATRIDSMLGKLIFVYGEEKGTRILDGLLDLVEKFGVDGAVEKSKKSFVDESDIVVITYGDQFNEEAKSHLQSLHEFVNIHLKDVVSAVHILPFYPYSSDDGFSVIDYFEVNSELGNWADIESLSKDMALMFDAVINHISVQSNWFQEYLKGNSKYRNFFIEADPDADYSTITRPRALPLLTKFETSEGTRHIWTTFSEDQIDLNYKDEAVLLKIVELLLFYVSKGAKYIRFDAIGYMWKSMETSCIHLEETHQLVQLFREVLNTVAPETVIITETNVPHKDNISYFGNGHNEAQMVYQFPLPPLTLHSFLTGDAKHLLEWADSLGKISEDTTFFNFLASHDGIGLIPAKGILTDEAVQAMVEKIKDHGGYVSYKSNGDGTQSPYELNINYFDALSNPNDEEDVKVDRFIAAHSILLCLAGVPGIYVHSLLGSRSYQRGVEQTGRYRSINREKLDRNAVEHALKTPTSLRAKVFNRLKHLIQKRRCENAFHPLASQQIIFANSHVFSILRISRDGNEKLICLVNVSDSLQAVNLELGHLEIETAAVLRDVITGQMIENQGGNISVVLEPYQVMWIKSEKN